MDKRSRDETENQPTRIHDCYYHLPIPTHRKHDYVIGVTGSDVIERDTTTRLSMLVTANCAQCTTETDLTASQIVYHPYSGTDT